MLIELMVTPPSHGYKVFPRNGVLVQTVPVHQNCAVYSCGQQGGTTSTSVHE